jgi:hypothetical protein
LGIGQRSPTAGRAHEEARRAVAFDAALTLKLPRAGADGLSMSRSVLIATAAAVAVAVALPSAASAAPTEHQASGVCPLKVANVVGGTVVVGVNLSDARSSAARKATCPQVGRVVRRLAGEGAERPETVNGYACTPSITGGKVTWKCTYRGGKPRTTITLNFAYRYAAG